MKEQTHAPVAIQQGYAEGWSAENEITTLLKVQIPRVQQKGHIREQPSDHHCSKGGIGRHTHNSSIARPVY